MFSKTLQFKNINEIYIYIYIYIYVFYILIIKRHFLMRKQKMYAYHKFFLPIATFSRTGVYMIIKQICSLSVVCFLMWCS